MTTDLGLELPGKENIPLDVIWRVDPLYRLHISAVQVHNTPGNGIVCYLGLHTNNTEGLTKRKKVTAMIKQSLKETPLPPPPW